MKISIDENMIAPCGMNCGLCIAHQREKNQCPGCRSNSSDKRQSCQNCFVNQCGKREGKDDFCYVCDILPCYRIKTLDKRYREKYNMSMIENLDYIKKHGTDAFVENEKKRWECSTCGGYICVHRGYCLNCSKS